MKGWSALRYQWFKDFQLWIFITLSLLVFRIVLIATYHEQIHVDTGFGDIVSAVLMGLHYDASTAVSFIAILFLASITTAFINWGHHLHRLRLWFASFFIILAVITFGIDIVFFYEYGDQFNQTLFGMVDDDTRAILVTIWKEYHPLRFLLLVIPAIYALQYVFKNWIAYTPTFTAYQPGLHAGRIMLRSFIVLLVFAGFVFVVRGSTLSTQPLRQHHAFISKDVFLNKTILNPFTSLRYAIQKRMWMQGDDALARIWPEKNLATALQLVTGKNTNNIDQAISHVVQQANANRPQHIFLVLLESHSGWTVWPEYRDMDFSPELSKLADQGIYFKNFIPSGSGTMPSLNALITGLPYSGLNVNYEPSALKPYPFSIAETFKRMGYRTRFYYGGFLGWQRVDNFMTAQGFDEIYGAGQIARDHPTNEWGVNDEFLFQYITDNMDKNTPSFNLILSTSNHPPYDLDLDKIGFSGHKLRDGIKETKTDTLKTLGHLWYTDQQTGKFVRNMSKLVDKPLFAITGDHTSRLKLKYPGDSVFQHTAVPFILYGPQVLDKPMQPATAGSHIDILPTLYELAAPAGFTYYALGSNLLDKTRDYPAIGSGYAISDNHFVTGNRAFPLPLFPSTTSVDLEQVNKYSRAAEAISWYRVRKGPVIK